MGKDDVFVISPLNNMLGLIFDEKSSQTSHCATLLCEMQAIVALIWFYFESAPFFLADLTVLIVIPGKLIYTA
jgi:hypothetical protein